MKENGTEISETNISMTGVLKGEEGIFKKTMTPNFQILRKSINRYIQEVQ